MTGTIKRDAGTGIQRVVKEVTRGLYSGESFDMPALAVRCEDGRLLTANGFIAELVGGDAAPDSEIAIAGGDRFLMLSDSWNAFDELAPVFATHSRRRAARSSPASSISFRSFIRTPATK